MNEHTKNTPDIIFLEGKKIIFRPIYEKDLERIIVWINNPQVRKYLTVYLPMTMEIEKKWLEQLSNNNCRDIILAVIDKESKEHMGQVGLHGINWKNKTATFGFMIGNKDFWNKGYGTEILSLTLKYAFHTLGLRKIKSSVLALNIGSIKVHKKCSFKKAGVLKKEYFVDGEYVDEILFEIFKEDWEKK